MELHGYQRVALAASERSFLSRITGRPIPEIVTLQDIEALHDALRAAKADGSEPYTQITVLLVKDILADCRALTHGGLA